MLDLDAIEKLNDSRDRPWGTYAQEQIAALITELRAAKAQAEADAKVIEAAKKQCDESCIRSVFNTPSPGPCQAAFEKNSSYRCVLGAALAERGK